VEPEHGDSWVLDDGVDDDRVVDYGADDDEPVLPGTTRDDTDEGWGESTRSNDQRLLEDRPPHW
jgi:hypothetical protein